MVFPLSSSTGSPKLSDADTLSQLSLDWANATKGIDVNRLGQIIADDWRGVGSSGRIKTKEEVLNYVQTRENRLESFEFGPLDVKVVDRVGVVRAALRNISSAPRTGRHTAFESVWMDVREKRGDKWVVVRSQSSVHELAE